MKRISLSILLMATVLAAHADQVANPKPAIKPAAKPLATKQIAAANTTIERALPQPQLMPLSPRLVVFPYTPDYIYPIHTKLGEYVHIQLAENEKVVTFLVEDKLGWPIFTSETKRDIFTKPLNDRGTSGTLITNLRRYELNFDVVKNGDWYQRVSWNIDNPAGDFPGIDLPASQSNAISTPKSAELTGNSNKTVSRNNLCSEDQVSVDHLNFAYKINGDADFKPTMVFDDGHFTRFKFPKVQDMPLLFALNPTTGEAELQDFVPCKGYYLVQALMPGGALLKLGKAEVHIVNEHGRTCSAGLFGLFKSCQPASNIHDE